MKLILLLTERTIRALIILINVTQKTQLGMFTYYYSLLIHRILVVILSQ